MAMNTSLARCLRTGSSTLLHQYPQLSTPGQQLVRRSQRSAYSLFGPRETNTEKKEPKGTGNTETGKQSSEPPTLAEQNSSESRLSPSEASKELENTLLDELNLGRPQRSRFNSTPENEGQGYSSELNTTERLRALGDRMRDIKKKSPALRTRVLHKYPATIATPFAPATPVETTTPNPSSAPLEGSLESLATQLNLEETIRPTIKPVSLKLGPKLGRQVIVQNDRGIDCASAIRMLEISCSANQLRKQERAQKFHVRRGQLRKDIRRERWRRLFKFSFTETAKKIQRMRDQGW